MTDPDMQRGWSLSDEDRGLLESLAQALRQLTPLAKCGNDLIALGEAWDAIEKILEGQAVEVNVGASVGFRRGDREFAEGLFLCLRIDEEEIRLDELNTTYSADAGSDHFTRDYAVLRPRGNFDEAGVWEWLAKLEEVRQFNDAKLNMDRDHV